MFKKIIFLENFVNFASNMVKKWILFAKLHTCPSKVDVFIFFFFFESPKNLQQDVGSRFFNFIIFLVIIILEKLEM